MGTFSLDLMAGSLVHNTRALTFPYALVFIYFLFAQKFLSLSERVMI